MSSLPPTNVVLFEAHHDDAVLFACYTLLRLKPRVVTVLGSAQVQERYGIDGKTREAENAKAFSFLGLSDWLSWLHTDREPNWDAIRDDMTRYDETYRPDEVWTPKWEVGGHDQHNGVSEAAFSVFSDRCRFYATYRKGLGRTRTGHGIEHCVRPDSGWPARKFQAMSAYVSQINLPNTRPWFSNWDMEWVESPSFTDDEQESSYLLPKGIK